MKNLQYDPTEPYEIDWHKGQRRFQTPVQGVRVYEHGEVQIYKSGDRDPNWRNFMYTSFGYDFRLLSTMIGCKFYTPDGRQVAKTQIPDGSYLYERDRIYRITWGKAISFYTPYADPSPMAVIPCTFRRKDKEKARLIELQPYFDFGLTLFNVREKRRAYISGNTRQMLAGKSPILPADLQDPGIQDFCWRIAACKDTVLGIIEYYCKDKIEVPFLYVKEK